MSKFDPNAPVVVDQVAIVRQDTTRAELVIQEVVKLDSMVAANQFAIGDLFSEIVEGNYYHAAHCESLPDFLKKLKEQHGFELSPREIQYRIKNSRVSKRLGITREQLLKARVSKIKSIMELDGLKDKLTQQPVDMSDHIVRLVGEAPLKTLAEIKAEVNELKGEIDEDSVIEMWKLPVFKSRREFMDETVDLAIAQSGDTVDNETKETKDVSKATAIERIFADWRSDPNNSLEQLGTPGDFSDELIHVDEEGNSWETMDV